MLWHRDRFFDLILDASKGTLKFPVVLPELPPRSPMVRDLQKFVDAQFAESLPDHRRIDPAKAAIRCAQKAGDVSITMTVLDGDYDYATRKLISLVHEVFLVFLQDGRYFDYLVEAFDLDPDHM